MRRTRMPQKRRSDAKATLDRAADLKAHSLPCHWLVFSPMELRELCAGIVSPEVRRMARVALRPGPGESGIPAVEELSKPGESGAWHPRSLRKIQEGESDGVRTVS